MRSEAGITLVEVLLAVVICAVGLVVAAQGIAASLRVEVAASNRERAAHLAGNLLARVEAGEVALQDAEGDFADEGEDEVAWTLTVENTDVENLVQATIRVEWEERGERRGFEVVRLFYQDDANAGLHAS